MAKVRSQGRCTVSQTDAAPRRELGSTSIICSCYSENVISRNTRIRNARHAAFHSCLTLWKLPRNLSVRLEAPKIRSWPGLFLSRDIDAHHPQKSWSFGCWKNVTAAWDF